MDIINRTLWMSELPTYDRGTLEPFWLEDREFDQVAEDLKDAIKKELKDKYGSTYDPMMDVRVAPVIEYWHAISLKARVAEERAAVYARLKDFHKCGCCTGLARRW